MNLIIETDLGHDPDDLFAILYLLANEVNVRAITISPGDPDQIAVARLICEQLSLSIPIGVSKLDRPNLSSGSIHHALLKKFSRPLYSKPDGYGPDIIKQAHREYPDSELFIIGPASSVGRYLLDNPAAKFPRATMQGGFLPHSIFFSANSLDKFAGKKSVGTFNLNGDRPGGHAFLSADIPERRMVGKNICHGIVFSSEYAPLLANGRNPAHSFYNDCLRMLKKEKKFHDPTAAVLHLHPEIGTWIKGKPLQVGSEWTTILDPEGDHILANINHNALWAYLLGCL